MDDLTRAIDARREIGKWLNEEPNREVDRRAMAELCVGFDLLYDGYNKHETAGAERQLLRLAKAQGYERVWCVPPDQTKWFAERKHPEKDGMTQVIPLDWLLQVPDEEEP